VSSSSSVRRSIESAKKQSSEKSLGVGQRRIVMDVECGVDFMLKRLKRAILGPDSYFLLRRGVSTTPKREKLKFYFNFSPSFRREIKVIRA
jgi:hypothetical protein